MSNCRLSLIWKDHFFQNIYICVDVRLMNMRRSFISCVLSECPGHFDQELEDGKLYWKSLNLFGTTLAYGVLMYM